MKLRAAILFLAFTVSGASAQTKINDSVIAVVNGVRLPQALVYAKALEAGGDPAKMNSAAWAEAVKQIVDEEVIIQLGKKLGVLDTAETHQAEAVIRSEVYQSTTSEAARTILLFKRLRELWVERTLTRNADEALTDQRLRSHYDANKAKYGFEAVLARHIVVKTKAEAELLIKTITPQTFADTAKRVSIGV